MTVCATAAATAMHLESTALREQKHFGRVIYLRRPCLKWWLTAIA